MKVVYIINEIRTGGLEKMVSLQTDYFVKHFDYEIEIIIVREKSGEKPAYKINKNIKLHYLNINFNGFKKVLFRVIKINKKLKEITPDIVVVCIDEVFGLYLPNLVRKSSPFIYQRHSTKHLNLVNSNGTKQNKIGARLKKIVISKAGSKYDRFVLLSEEHKKDWPYLDNLAIINNPNTLFTEGRQAKLENKVVIAVGRQDYVKGYDMLLKAWGKVVNDNPEWVLKLYGKFKKSLELNKLSKDLGLGDTIQFNEHTNDITVAYLDASVLVCSSRTEGFSLVIVEAMSLGLPAVSFDCPYGPRAIIKDSVDGVLVEANNIDRLSDALKLLISDIELRKSMGAMAIKNVQRFSLDKIMNQWKSLFEEVLLD